MNIFVDERIRREEEEKLKEFGTVIKIPKQPNIYEEISSHPDIFMTKIKEQLICAPLVYNLISSKTLKGVIKGIKNPSNNYPEDVLYNVCNIGNIVVGNFSFTDAEILKEIEKKRFEKGKRKARI